MALFGRTSLEDPELKQIIGRRRVLASGRSPDGQVVGLADRLVYKQDGVWRQLAWHEVDRGAWDGQSGRLVWSDVHGHADELELTEAGPITDLFNERVTASIACVRTVDLATRGKAVITARRDLGNQAAPLIWGVSPGKGVSSEQADADPLVALELERLRAEYDLG